MRVAECHKIQGGGIIMGETEQKMDIQAMWEGLGISNDFLFGKGRHLYSFKNFCEEDKEVLLGDDTTKIFLNTKSRMEDISKDLRAFLDYVAGRGGKIP